MDTRFRLARSGRSVGPIRRGCVAALLLLLAACGPTGADPRPDVPAADAPELRVPGGQDAADARDAADAPDAGDRIGPADAPGLRDAPGPPDGRPADAAEACDAPADAGGAPDSGPRPDAAAADTTAPCALLRIVDLGRVCSSGRAELAALGGQAVVMTGIAHGCSVGGPDYVCDWWQDLDAPCCPWNVSTDWYVAGCAGTNVRLTLAWHGEEPMRPGCVLDHTAEWCFSAPFFDVFRPRAFVGGFSLRETTVYGFHYLDVSASADDLDSDVDGRPDSCDPDRDGDAVPDVDDVCPTIPNPDQERPAGDDRGELCNGLDDDCDGQTDEGPIPPAWYGCVLGGGCWEWARVACVDGVAACDYSDAPGYGGPDDDCDFVDDDCDGQVDEDRACPNESPWDNCPEDYNPDQADLDLDGEGDACDPDVDGDGWPNENDCAPRERAVHPEAAESCDGRDEDCDGTTDEDCPG